MTTESPENFVYLFQTLFFVFSGEHDIRRREGSEQYFSVKRIIVHPYYQRATTNNDMGEQDCVLKQCTLVYFSVQRLSKMD